MSLYVLTWQNFQKRTISLQHRLGEYIGLSFNRYPGVYTGLGIITAIAAHALLLLFPLLVLVALYNLYHVLTADAVDWVFLVIWLSIGLLAAYASYGFLRVKIVPPAGLPLTASDAPGLFEIIENATDNFVRPGIDRVLLTADYELDIRKVPRWFLPVWSSNVLIIGLPVMLCHSPEHFACMINRRVGQFSRRHNLVTNWLYQLRSIWPMYRLGAADREVEDAMPQNTLYRGFSHFYCFITTTTARKEELNADSYAMQVYPDEVVREMISADEFYRFYLLHNYWPAVGKILAISASTRLTPYQKMKEAVRNRLDEDKISTVLSTLQQAESGWQDSMPSLSKRLANIGHTSPSMAMPEGECAVDCCLGEAAGAVLEELDRRWLAARDGGQGRAFADSGR